MTDTIVTITSIVVFLALVISLIPFLTLVWLLVFLVKCINYVLGDD